MAKKKPIGTFSGKRRFSKGLALEKRAFLERKDSAVPSPRDFDHPMPRLMDYFKGGKRA